LAACILDSEKNIKNTKNIENRIVKKYFFTENIRNLYFNLITYKILFIKLENNDWIIVILVKMVYNIYSY
jgi:hypothetical protein